MSCHYEQYGPSGSPRSFWWKNGVCPAGRRVPWPADSRSTAASSTASP